MSQDLQAIDEEEQVFASDDATQARIEKLSQNKTSSDDKTRRLIHWSQQREQLAKSNSKKRSKSGSKSQNHKTKTTTKTTIKSKNKSKTKSKTRSETSLSSSKHKNKKKTFKNIFEIGCKLRDLPTHDTKHFKSTSDIKMRADLKGL